MRQHDPFKHIGGKGARFSENDPLKHIQWSPQKIALVALIVSLPYLAIAISIYFLGLKMLAIVLVGILVSFLFIGLLINSTLTK